MTVETNQTTALDDRIIDSTIGALELISIHLGRRLGLYEQLQRPQSVKSLADSSAVDERYAREWLEQQAVAGLITTDSAADWANRTYWLNDAQIATFVTSEDPSHVSPLSDMVVGIANVVRDVAEAYKTGGGVPYSEYEAEFRNGQAAVNRPAFTHDLPTAWLEGTPDVVETLTNGGLVLDLGCGAGWSTIAMAKAFPKARVVGVDSDPASVADAVANAEAEGVDVEFVSADAADLDLAGKADLVLILEALHDMARPVEALSTARALLSDNGAVVVADEQVSTEFVAHGEDLDRLMYAFSVSHCLPASMAEEGSAAIGTVIRPDMVQTMAEQAGFGSFDLTDIDGGFFHIYVIRP